MDTTSQLSRRVAFILCEPAHPGNIGSAARAVKTMGFRDLRVVAPREPGYWTHPEAVAYATSSVDVLEASRDYPTLSQALEGVHFAWAMTGYDREFGPRMETMRKAALETCARLSVVSEGTVAFVFGCERSGMTNDEVGLCQGCAAIQADPESPSLNLAQAVQIAAYEMHMALLSAEGHEETLYDWQTRFDREPPAPVEAVEGFLKHWEEAMISCGVHDPERPRVFMPTCRRIFERAALTRTDIDLLRGVCAAVICPKRERAGMKKGKKAKDGES